MKPNIETIVPRIRTTIARKMGKLAGDQVVSDAPLPKYIEDSVDLAVRTFGENAGNEMYFKEIVTPTEEDLKEMVSKLRAASRIHYERGSAYETNEESSQRRVREDVVNEARQKEAAAYGDMLRILGQGHIVDSVSRRR